MTTIRFHSVTSTAATPNWGTDSCDFRGDSFIGDKQGDHHATQGREVDVDDNSPLVQEVLTDGPRLNSLLASVWKAQVDSLHVPEDQAAALIPHLRLGVWDKTPPVGQ